MSVTSRRLTHTDLAGFPDDGKRYELIEGVLHVAPAPNTTHQRLIVRLMDLFAPLRRGEAGSEIFLAPYDVRFSAEDVVQPDLLVVRPQRATIVGAQRIEGAPDLIVEILSPGTRVYDEVVKAALYAREGVTEYWLVDPELATVRVFALVEGQYQAVPHDGRTATSALFPELTVEIASLFTDLW